MVLTLVDDDPTPSVSLLLSSPSISEAGGVATVTARLSGPSSEAVTVAVSAAPGLARDFALSAARTLTVAAGATTSTGTVTVAAFDNAVLAPPKRVTVSGAVSGGNGAAAPRPLALTLTDDDARPALSLVLSSSSISESGGVATVTAALSFPAREAVTVTVSAAALPPASSSDFTLAGTALTVAAGRTASAGTVTVAAVNDADDEPDKRVRIRGVAAGGGGVANPAARRADRPRRRPCRPGPVAGAVAGLESPSRAAWRR